VEDTAALGEALVRTRTACPPWSPATDRSIVLVIDSSASMSGRKLEAAKELARLWVMTVSPGELVSVVTVANEAKVLLPPLRGTQRTKIADAITTIEASDRAATNLYPGLRAAFEIEQGIAMRRLVVVISDGEASSDGLVALVQDMHAARITVSAVSLGGPDQELLRAIAGAGDGQFLVFDGTMPKLSP
jgi:Mg-chelatase subunit ChlD